MNGEIFILGGITFIVAFTLFKVSAFILFKHELEAGKKVLWSHLFKVFFTDLLILILGVLGTGILFMTLLKIAHG
tara:strand:+ start:210 stop:434 length:225 start_codon:yes stop_codon:yes gene_type:complete